MTINFSTQISQINSSIEQGQMVEATAHAKSLYTNLVNITYDKSIPEESYIRFFFVTSKLVDVIGRDELQFEDEFKYEIAKTCRLCADLLLFSNLLSKRKFYPESLETILSTLKKVKKTLPTTGVATEYELEYCYLATDFLKSDYIKEFVKKYGLEFVKSIFSLDPGEILKALVDPSIQISRDLYDKLKNKWFLKALQLHLYGTIALAHLNNGDRGVLFKQQVLPLVPQSIDEGSIALCSFEVLREFSEKATELKLDKLQKRIFSGPKAASGEPRKVGLKKFISLGLDLPKNKHNEFWRVRYRATEFFFTLIQNPKAEESIKTKATSILAEKLKAAKLGKLVENEQVLRLMDRSFKSLLSASKEQDELLPLTEELRGKKIGYPVQKDELSQVNTQLKAKSEELKVKKEKTKLKEQSSGQPDGTEDLEQLKDEIETLKDQRALLLLQQTLLQADIEPKAE